MELASTDGLPVQHVRTTDLSRVRAAYLCGQTDGPVLGQTDLYLLKPTLQIHPILARDPSVFSLQFDLSTGAFYRLYRSAPS